MKKYVVFLILMLCFSNARLSAEIVFDLSSGKVTDEAVQLPKFSVTQINKGYEISYDFSNVEYECVDSILNLFVWKFPGFTNVGSNGVPALPYKTDSFVIDPGVRSTLYVKSVDYITLKTAPLASVNEYFESDFTPFEIQQSIRAGEFSLNNFVSEGKSQEYRDRKILNISVRPINYDISNSQVAICKKITYLVIFEESSNSNSTVSESTLHDLDPQDPFLSSNTLNWNDQQPINKIFSLNPVNLQKRRLDTYLILSHPALSAATNKLAEWKRKLGYNVIVIENGSWSAESIKSTVQELWNATSTLKYLLLMGDVELLPSVVKTYQFVGNYNDREYSSDISYACTGGDDDDVPDLYYGRIPVKNNAEALIVVDKTINHETQNRGNAASAATHIAYFQDDDGEGKETRRFCLTSEEVLTEAERKGLTVNRLFHNGNSNTLPFKWFENWCHVVGSESSKTIGYFKTNDDIPDYLLHPSFSWKITANNILSALRQDNCYVFYRGHGSKETWSKISDFNQGRLSSLSGSGKAPIILSIACHTGNFASQSDCFAETLLKIGGAGCTAILAATHSSFTRSNDYFSIAFFKSLFGGLIDSSIELELDHFPAQTNVLGALVNTAHSQVRKHYSGDYDHAFFNQQVYHILGDPSLQLYVNPPQISASYNLSIEDDKYVLKATRDAEATTCIYNSKTGTSSVYIGSINLQFDSLEGLYMTFSGPNQLAQEIEIAKIPIISIGKMAAQSDSPKLVEDGKLWKQREWESENVFEAEKCYRDIEQRFDGTTEIDGKTYHNLKARQTYPRLTDEHIVAYMREEDGRVYTRGNMEVAKDMLNLFYCDNFLRFEPAEALVYDFNLLEGDTYHWFSDSEINARYKAGYDSWISEPVEVTEIRSIDYEGKAFRVQDIKYRYPSTLPNWYSYFRGMVIEQIGDYNGNIAYPGMPHAFESGGIYDIEVYAPDGSLIYKSDRHYAEYGEEGVGSASIDGATAPRFAINDHELTLTAAEGNAEVSLVSLHGNVLLHTTAQSGGKIDLSDLASGIYLIQIRDRRESVTAKIKL